VILYLELMMRMGFSADEIKESLVTNKYDEVMATYLLLDEKRVRRFLPSAFFVRRKFGTAFTMLNGV